MINAAKCFNFYDFSSVKNFIRLRVTHGASMIGAAEEVRKITSAIAHDPSNAHELWVVSSPTLPAPDASVVKRRATVLVHKLGSDGELRRSRGEILLCDDGVYFVN